MGTKFAGSLRRHLPLDGLELAETTYRPGQSVEPHSHDHPLLVVVLSGRMTEVVEGTRRGCPQGSVFFHPRERLHAHTFGRGARCLSVQFDPAWRDGGGGVFPSEPVVRRDPQVSEAVELLTGEFLSREKAAPEVLKKGCLAILRLLSYGGLRHAPVEPLPVTAVLDRIDSDPGAELGLGSLAEEVGVSAGHLARCFRRQEGMTVGAYIRWRRIVEAKMLLRTMDVSLSDIALRLGFYDQAHFTRVFRDHVGCPPGAFRARTDLSWD